MGGVLGWASLALQLVLSIHIAIGNGHSAGWGIFIYLGFYTVLTNLLVAFTLTAACIGSTAPFWVFWRGAGATTAVAASIAIVGLVYFFVLRHTWAPQGLDLLADVLLHYVMPGLFLLWWWRAVRARDLHWRVLFWWWVYPLGYFAYVLVRGALWGVYPYPFIDLATLGAARTAANAAGVLVGFSGVALSLIALGRIKPAPR